MGGSRENQKAHKRANKKLPLLLKEQGECCHWCNRPVILLRSLQQENILEITADWVRYRIDDEEKKSYIATTDHLHPVKEGGTADIENLVVACPPCNRKRTEDKASPHPCKDCGVPVYRYRRCIECREKVMQNYFKECYIPRAERKRTHAPST